MPNDSLNIFGTTYTNVAGIIATDTNDTERTFIRPQGTKSISENGTGIDVSEYASVDVNVSGGGGGSASKKQIYFMDYDGTVLYSYSTSEWQSVSSLPNNPSHEGLTAQGWNWTKAQIDAQLVAMPDGDIWVGMMYVTDDGKTRIYVHLEDGRLHPYLGICPNGTVIVDWGDNSATSTITGTALTTVQYADHVYASEGDYVITLTVSSGSFAFSGTNNTSYTFKKDISNTGTVHRVYTNAIQKIELGNKVSVSSYAFNYCYSLESITVPSSVTTIGNYAFYYCYSLKSVTIPSGIASVGNYEFDHCYSIKSVAIPSSVTTIGTYAFNYCCSLESITIPSSVTTIGSYAFQNCGSLVSIILPSLITSISAYMFYACYSLANINIPSGVTSIGTDAFYGCYSLESITIPSGVTNIGGSAFYYCTSLESIVIPSSVTTIGTYAFNFCAALKKITILGSITSIGSSTFASCFSLVKITIPSSVTDIGGSAFSGCQGMAEYHLLRTTPPTLGSSAFNNIQPECKIYVPSESLSAYQSATNWSTYASYMVGE